MKKLLTIAGIATLATGAFAQVWTEQGDAPELLPGQITVGNGALTRIDGNIGQDDADLYCIRVVNYQAFRASTVGLTGFDTQLFLFNANGMGVTHDDDDPGGGLQSTLTSQFLTSNGIYFLGISRYNRDPQSAGGLIWANSPFNVERAPDGPGAGGALSSWTGTYAAAGAYSIALSGVEYHAIPEPATLIALGVGLAAIAARRRRK